MNRKLTSTFFVFSLVTLVGLTIVLAGCSVFGGNEKKPEPAKQAKAAPEPVAVTAEAAKPLPAAETTDESNFESGKLDYEEKTVNGVLNWSKGFIRAKGFGVPPQNPISDEQGKLMAFRAAYADALANLLEITNGVRVTATTTVKDYVVKDHTVELKVAGIIKGSKQVRRVFDEDKNVAIVEVAIAMEDVAMGIPRKEVSFNDSDNFEAWETKKDATLKRIAGGDEKLAAILKNSQNLDELEKKLEKMSSENAALANKNSELLANIQLLVQEIGKLKNTSVPSSYTGIVVNAAGSGIKPCMAPNIYYKDGDTYKLLYGIDDGRARDANMHALVVWERTLTGASDNTRVTRTPLIVNATQLAKEQSSLAVSKDDAQIIQKVNNDARLLEEGRVVVVR